MADGNGNELGHFSPYYFMYLHSFVKYIDIYNHICTHVCVYTYSLMHPVIEIELPENQKFRCVYICTVPSHMTISLHIATLSAYWLDTLRNALVMYDVSYKALCTINNYFDYNSEDVSATSTTIHEKKEKFREYWARGILF